MNRKLVKTTQKCTNMKFRKLTEPEAYGVQRTFLTGFTNESLPTFSLAAAPPPPHRSGTRKKSFIYLT